MHTQSTVRGNHVRAKQQAGQSLLIALAILFLLGFLGALFSAIVIRNLRNAGTSSDTINTDYFAQAGVNYANSMLQNSPLGADWRPPLQYVDSTAPATAQTLQTNAKLAAPAGADPDFRWLNAGYTRYNMNGGRFLVKVTYNPDSSSGPSETAKFIRIDSIGRMGTINAQDPTTYTNAPPDLRRTELVAYKPIGIVDYSRFITNKDNRTDTAGLGMPSFATNNMLVPVASPGVYDIDPNNLPSSDPYTPGEYPLITTYGSANAYNSLVNAPTSPIMGGGTLRSNMNLRLYGINDVYLNTAYGDDWEIAGNLTFDGYNTALANGGTTTATGTYTQLPTECIVNTPGANPATTVKQDLFPSNDPNFLTLSGAIRDGSLVSDVNGYPRQIRRLNPPLMDTVDSATGKTRYQSLTAGGQVVVQRYSATSDFSPATININNDSDIQHESPNGVGQSAHSLRNDWLNQGTSDTGGSWEGSFYNPPGALITFGPVAGYSSAAPTYGITVTRSDVDSTNTPVQWLSPNSSGGQQIGQTLFLSYGALPATTTPNPTVQALGYLDVNQPVTTGVPNDIVIHASGNIRVRGIISDPNGPPQHVTIVTDGIAYIDGSIVKGNPLSSIAILARQHVCLNTTQFLAGAPNLFNSVTNDDFDPASSIGPGSPADIRFNNAEVLTEESLYGAQVVNPPVAYAPALYVEQSAGALSDVSQGVVDGNAIVSATGTVSGTTPVRDVYTMGPANTLPINVPVPDVPYLLNFGKSDQFTGDWLLQKAAVLPGDIEIQAVLYAENGSFFVIPGEWFNSDSSDTLTHAFDRGQTNAQTQDSRYPFYGQPIDLRISIEGAVSENVPANISDESSWLQKWGWIPRFHGSDTLDLSPHEIPVPTAGPSPGAVQVGIGLNFSYDHLAGFPYTVTGANSPVSYLRQDRYGRPLPFAPALPVSPDLLYSGQPTAN